MKDEAVYGKLAELASSGKIPSELFAERGIKKGLRNEDGTGVPVILTRISDVTGYEKRDGNPVPVEGRLIYRGIEIQELVDGFQSENRLGFEDTAYLLMFGDLPNAAQSAEFNSLLVRNRPVPDQLVREVILPRPHPDIMLKLIDVVSSLGSEDEHANDTSTQNVTMQCVSLIAKFPAIVAYSYIANLTKPNNGNGATIGIYLNPPNPRLSTAENFLQMVRRDQKYTSLEAGTLDMLLMAHADHSGGNNSAFTTHCVTSSRSDTYSTICAALASLKGPLHGGASEKVIEMMEHIKSGVKDWKDRDEVKAYLRRVLEKKVGDCSGLIYGVGHPVYTLSDPRAVLLSKKAEELAAATGRTDEFTLLKNVADLAQAAFTEVKGHKKVIAPNVDFYSGFVYSCLGVPVSIETAIFAMGRIAGWSAHRIEELVNANPIMRPASIYVGPGLRSYVPMAQRG
ncbi:MAG: citrate synthase [Nanoarchaeota archaeon]|nr:citrate synthase [Nanoarchaeota archaeon]MBU1004997.1 citrate synthase [Nanoarchaeota archaeon]MBU1945889.1 citrate synthase [Nanoarchaeota archaeon]